MSERSEIRQASYTWRNLEMVGGGFITGIVAHPRVSGLFYARTDVGGAYRFDSEQQRWVPITDWIGQRDFRLTGVESIAIDPSDPDVVFLALGIYNQPHLKPTAICRSRDRGASFQLTWVPFGMGGNEAGRGGGERLAVDPAHGERLFFGSRDQGLWQSSDAGVSWDRVLGFPEIDTALVNPTPGQWNYLTQAVGVVFVVFVPGDEPSGQPTAHVIAAVSTQATSLFESRDAGASWAPIAEQPVGFRPIRCALNAKGVLFITYGREPGPNTMFDGAVYALDTSSGHFTDVTPIRPDPERGQTFGYAGVAVDAVHPDCVMVTTAYRGHVRDSGGDEVFRSLDGGRSWRAVGQAGRRDHRRAPWLAFGESEAHVGHWMYALSIDPFDSNRAYYATGQTLWGTRNLVAVDRGETPEWAVCASGIEETVPLVLKSPPRDAALFAGTGDISGFAFFEQDGTTEAIAMHDPTFKDTTGIDFPDRDPSLVVRVGSRGWNRERDQDRGAVSLDGGRSWSAFRSYPSASAFEGQIAVSADGEAWLWAPRNEAPSVSFDSGSSWAACRGLADAALWVFSDRVNPSIFYAFNREGGAAFESIDRGASFTRTTVLPGERLHDVALVPGSSGELWIACDERLHRTEDAGRSWTLVSTIGDVTHVAVGRAREGAPPMLFVVAHADGEDGFFASADRGMSWQRLNDERHRFGQVRAICGDPKRVGRLYVATGGRGVICGDPSH